MAERHHPTPLRRRAAHEYSCVPVPASRLAAHRRRTPPPEAYFPRKPADGPKHHDGRGPRRENGGDLPVEGRTEGRNGWRQDKGGGVRCWWGFLGAIAAILVRS